MSAENFPKDYMPEAIWRVKNNNQGQFTDINTSTSGARYEKKLPQGRHPLQLYSLATPNGVKVTILLEELLSLGHHQAEYDAYTIHITQQEQFSSGFVEINPNSKIPTLVDYTQKKPLAIFESGAILQYLAEKFACFIPNDIAVRAECFSWLFWQMSSAPYLGGGFGHFYHYAPIKIQYCIDRYTSEVKRQLDVLDHHLESRRFMCGEEYSVSDIAIWPWYGALVLGKLYEAATFLQVDSYTHVIRWAKDIADRDAVRRAIVVNKVWGEEKMQLKERHQASDIDQLFES